MSITCKHYGCTQDGREVKQYLLENSDGTRAAVIDYGCVVTNIWVKDKNGKLRDVVLGYDTLLDYELGSASLGTFVGRYANRIERSEFYVDGKTYRLDPNDGPNHLHGSFAKKVFEGSIEDDSLVLRMTSPDGDEGFPGTMEVTVTYTLTEENGLVMDYTATTDAPTIVNFTNHSYFNLEGQNSGTMLGQTLKLNAVEFTEGNAETCPTGRILPVAGTPMDFTEAKPIGRDIAADYDQLKMCKGYDHNFVLNKAPGMLGLAAVAHAEDSGITMETYTTQPGMQLYTANFLDKQTRPGKGGFKYPQYAGFCLETQHYPCSPSHPDFPSVELWPDSEYHETTIYKFITE